MRGAFPQWRPRELLLEIGARKSRRLSSVARSIAQNESEKESLFPKKQFCRDGASLEIGSELSISYSFVTSALRHADVEIESEESQ
jgi:hypothetical protein